MFVYKDYTRQYHLFQYSRLDGDLRSTTGLLLLGKLDRNYTYSSLLGSIESKIHFQVTLILSQLQTAFIYHLKKERLTL